MKALVVFFSRTGTTKQVAEKIVEIAKCEMEEIIDHQDRSGAKGYLMSGKEAMMKDTPIIERAAHSPEAYDVVIIGTPVWAYTMSSPVRTYINDNKNKFKSVAFFCTMGSSGDERTFNAMEEECYKKPRATLTLKTKEVKQNQYIDKVKEFLKQLQLA